MGPCKDMWLALLHHFLARTLTGPSKHIGQDTQLCSRHALLAKLIVTTLSRAVATHHSKAPNESSDEHSELPVRCPMPLP